MKKLLLLLRVLRRCGRASKDTAAASSHTGSLTDLMMPICGILVMVGMFFAGRYLALHEATLGPALTLFPTVMLLGCIMAFFLAVPLVINQLYMSNDLDVLITLPFTDLQIVVCKLISAGRMSFLLCCGAVIPCGLGIGLYAHCFDALGWVTMVLSGPMLGLCMISMVTVLIILVMRAFRFVRSRNAISLISTLLMFGLTVACFMLSQSSLDVGEMDHALTAVAASMSGLTNAIPVITLCMQAMQGGGILPLLEALALTVAMVAVLIVLARLFYFSAALGMQDANGTKSRMSDEDMRRSTRASGMRTALRRREIRTILRTPTMLTNGYLYSIVLPFVVLVPILVKLGQSLNESMQQVGASLLLDVVRQMLEQMAPTWEFWVIGIVALELFLTSLSVCFSTLSYGCISREGKDYAILKSLPLPMETVVMVKRDVALLFNGISSVLFPTILAIVGVALRLMPAWTIAVVLVQGAAGLVLMVDVCSLLGLRKPNLNWESEADACKSNYPGLIIWIALLVIMVGAAFVLSDLDLTGLTGALAIGCCVLPLVLAIVFDMRLHSAAAKLGDRI